MYRALILAVTLAWAGVAHASDLSVVVRTRAGAPVENAVVTFKPAAGVPTGPIRFEWPMRLTQRNITFDPQVLIVPLGAEVAFPNFDSVRHHVYSFSPGNRFELRLFGRDETRSYRFTKTGIAAVGCNIHDRMSAFIVVVDTPYAMKTGADGRATLRGASGAGVLTVWRQDVRSPSNTITRPIAETRAAAGEMVVVDLRAAPTSHAH